MNPQSLFRPRPNLARLFLAKRKNFSSLEKSKNLWPQSIKIPKSTLDPTPHTYSSSRVNGLCIWYGYVRNVRSHTWGSEKLKSTPGQNSWLNVEKEPITLFWYFFNPHESHPTSIKTNTGTNIKKHATCVNAPVKFCNNLYCSIQEVRYVQITKFSFWLPFLESSAFIFSKQLQSKQIYFWKV